MNIGFELVPAILPYLVVFMELTDAIGKLKAQIQEKVGIPVEKQPFVFDGKQSEDLKKVADNKIQKQSKPQLLALLRGGKNSKMLVKVLYRQCNATTDKCVDRTLELDVYGWECAIDLKEKIGLRTDIAPTDQELYKFDAERQLDDHLTLYDSGIRTRNMIDLEIHHRHEEGNNAKQNGREGKMVIKVEDRENLTSPMIYKVLELDVYGWETIEDVKEKIALREHMPTKFEKLYKSEHGQQELSGHPALEKCGISNGQKLILLVEEQEEDDDYD